MTERALTLPVANGAQVRRPLLALLRSDFRLVVTTVIFQVLAAACGVASPWLLGRLIDEVARGADISAIDRLAAAVVAFAGAQAALTRVAQCRGMRFGEGMQARVRERFLDNVLALPPSVVERSGTGDLLARGTSDIGTLGASLRYAVPVVTIAGLQFVFILVAALLVEPRLGALGLVGVLGVVGPVRWYLRRATDAYLAQGAGFSALAEELSESFAGARTTEVLRLHDRRRAACERAIESTRSAQERTLFLRSVLYPSVDVATALPAVLALVVGFVLVEGGTTTIGAVVASVLYMRRLADPVATLLQWLEQLQSTLASLARVEGLTKTRAGDSPRLSHLPLERGHHTVSARGVHYAYEGLDDVLESVDLDIRPGDRVALVGPSGAGKSTLARLLAGTDRPRVGTISIGGVAVSDIAPDELRRHVLLVTQEPHVFLGNLRENVVLGAIGATDDDVRRALVRVGAQWAKDLPDGIHTQLGFQGHNLDFGQVQQLALARVLVADPQTVILDEATAMLDARSAQRTEQAFAAAMRDRTIVTIAHRLQTARDADWIAVMSEGRVAEVGTHDELLASGGTYADLWRSWADDRQPPAEDPTAG